MHQISHEGVSTGSIFTRGVFDVEEHVVVNPHLTHRKLAIPNLIDDVHLMEIEECQDGEALRKTIGIMTTDNQSCARRFSDLT